MLDRFARLCEIPSPTGEEREVADAVLEELREFGVDVAEDASATPARAGAGNLIARAPGRSEPWLSFFAADVPGLTLPDSPKAQAAMDSMGMGGGAMDSQMPDQGKPLQDQMPGKDESMPQGGSMGMR